MPHWRSFLICLITAALSFFALTRAVPPFSSQTVVMLQEGSGLSAAMANQNMGVSALFGAIGGASNLRVLREILMSDDTIIKLDRKVGFISYFERNGNLYERFLSDAADPDRRSALLSHVGEIKIDDRANVMTITAQAHEAAYAQLMAASLVDIAQRRMNEMAQAAARDQIGFMETETSRLAAADLKAQQKLKEYQSKTGLTAAEIGISVGGSGLPQVGNETMLLWQEKLAELQVKRSGLRQFLKEDAPEVKLVDAEIGAIEKQIRERKERLLPSKSNDINIAEARIEFANLLYEAALSKEMYMGAMRATTQARAEVAGSLKRVDMVQSPTLPVRPQRGRMIINLMLALLVGSLNWILIRQYKRYVHAHTD